MPSILDFSSAFPWLLAGFLAGVIAYWLVRVIFGIDRRRRALLDAAESALDEERRISADSASRAAILDAERQRLTSDLNQVSPRAALVPQLERQLTDLRHADAARQNLLGDADKELAQLRQEAETQTRTAKYYEDEFARLFAEHDGVSKTSKLTADELARAKAGLDAATRGAASDTAKLQAELATAKTNLEAVSRDAAETVRLRSELASAKASLEAAASDASELTKLRAELAATNSGLTATKADLDRQRADDSDAADALSRITADYESKLKSAAAEMATRTAEARKNGEDAARLRAEIAAIPPVQDLSAELARLKSDLSVASSSLSAARSGEHSLSEQLKALQQNFQEVRRSLDESSMLAASRHDEIERLKSQVAAMPGELENYRRFKDALEAANRIAAGLPDKT